MTKYSPIAFDKLPDIPLEELNERERRFVIAFLDCWNASEAARRSGSKVAAGVAGFKMLRKPNVQAAIRYQLENMAMSANEVLARLSMMAMGSLEDFLNDRGEIDINKAKRNGIMFLVKRYKTRRTTLPGGVVKHEAEIELHDSQAALVHLGRYHGLWIDRAELTGANGGPIQFEDIKARLMAKFAALPSDSVINLPEESNGNQAGKHQ